MANLNTPHSSAAASSSMASSSSASTSYGKWDAFINHRGVDVKNTFASHLYRRLTSYGLRVFLDRDELEEGENFPSQIEQAIRGASLHIAIFSPRYAQSTWCLQELVLMVQSGATILPVFYKVDPSVVRWTLKSGAYFEDLRKLEQKTSHDCDGELKPRYSSDTVQNWRNALSAVADTSGFVLHGDEDDEGELLDDVVKSVLKKVPKPLLDVAEHPTGLNLKLEEFEKAEFEKAVSSKQEAERVGPKVVGIVGMGGIGKTTLAKAFFNLRKSDYSNSSFLFEVRENTRKHGINYLQSKLIRDLTGLDVRIESRDEGIGMLERHLSCCRHALVVLDDVDHISQVKALFPNGNILGYDSLILYTSRNKHVLASSGVSESSMYYLRGLNPSHSEELFCSYAFNQSLPLPEFEDMAHRFVRACDGLPLSLKVLGALVRGQNESYWEEILNQLNKILPTTEIQDVLKISYDSLSPNEKQIFLDIACFFIGEREDTAISIWGSVVFQNLHNKCLLELDVDSNFLIQSNFLSVRSAEPLLDPDRGGTRIKMHDHIRDLGRHISQGGEMPRRLWHPTTNEIKDLLERSSREITEVRGITFQTRSGMVWYKRWMGEVFGSVKYSSGFCGISNLQLIDIADGRYLERILKKVRSSHLKWLRCHDYPYTCLPSWIAMESLTVLHVKGDRLKTLWQHESQAPLELRELTMRSPSFSKFPKSIGQLKHLQKISLYSDRYIKRLPLKSLPEEFSNLSSLKHLTLYHCHHMRSLPESFGMLTNLQHVDLRHASRLQMLPESFGNLIRLKTLYLGSCSNLTISSTALGNITTLELLNIEYCENVREVPPQVAHQRCLKYLTLKDTNIKELPSWIGNLSNLEALTICNYSLKLVLPDHFAQYLAKLEELFIGNCEIEYLPQDLLKMKMNNLRKLRVWNCPWLREVSFKRTEGERERGRELNKTLESLHGNDNCLFQLHRECVCPNLQSLVLEECQNLIQIGELCGLSKLQRLDMNNCVRLEELPNIGMLISLEHLCVSGCIRLKSIPGLAQLTNLKILRVGGCHEMVELSGAKHLMLLKFVAAHNCPKLWWEEGLREELRQRGVVFFPEPWFFVLSGGARRG